MQLTVVKIDLCGSKTYAAQREAANPTVRTDALKRLLTASQASFPNATAAYPSGSFHKAEGDAVYYVLEKPSVALRGAIEFMQLWFNETYVDLPDCRVFLDRSSIDVLEVVGRTELTGRAFENISLIEKGRPEGRIYVSRGVVDAVDSTMARFGFIETLEVRTGESLGLFCVDFDDPRTVRDTSLVHALFVAHPRADEARERIFELFLFEYLLEANEMRTIQEFSIWARAKDYSLPSNDHLMALLKRSPSFEQQDGIWRLTDVARAEVTASREEYRESRTGCVAIVREALRNATRRSDADEGLPLEDIAEEYLCGVFSETRIMANYFRSTEQLFDSPPDLFDRFDYILRRRLDSARCAYYAEWRRGFITGLKAAASDRNAFISAVFHNVLATYYLNRAGQVSAYQVERLKERAIYLDTNVLYSLLVEASPFHEVASYFIERLAKLGTRARVLPISVWEYEESLLFVERNYDSHGPREPIVRRNPWLFQQFMSDRARYLDSMAVCRQAHSVARDLEVTEENHQVIATRLSELGLELEANTVELSQAEADEMWSEQRNWMTSNKWDLDKYWSFIHQDFPASVRLHDMTCIATMSARAAAMKADALGPKVMFVTVDGKLWRMRGRYPFICSPSQFLEFILPYLFLCDIPVTDARDFPNRLLAAQLGTLLVKRPPELAEIARAYFRNPRLASEDPRKVIADITDDAVRALSNQRFRQLVLNADELAPGERGHLAEMAAGMLEEVARSRESADSERKRANDAQAEIEKRDSTIEKLQRTVAYWRAQVRRK